MGIKLLTLALLLTASGKARAASTDTVVTASMFTGCGTTPTVNVRSNCLRGAVTLTAGLLGTCTIAFPASCFDSTPFCVFTGDTQRGNFSVAGGAIGDVVIWHCYQ
ncbi:MAG: hypothetical protein V4510_13525 [bacterium]